MPLNISSIKPEPYCDYQHKPLHFPLNETKKPSPRVNVDTLDKVQDLEIESPEPQEETQKKKEEKPSKNILVRFIDWLSGLFSSNKNKTETTDKTSAEIMSKPKLEPEEISVKVLANTTQKIKNMEARNKEIAEEGYEHTPPPQSKQGFDPRIERKLKELQMKQVEILEIGVANRNKEVMKDLDIRKYYQKQIDDRLEKFFGKKGKSKVLGWVQFASIVGAIGGAIVMGILAFLTGGVSAVILAVQAVATTVGGGASLFKGIVDHEMKKDLAFITEKRFERDQIKTHNDSHLEKSANALNNVIFHYSSLGKTLRNLRRTSQSIQN